MTRRKMIEPKVAPSIKKHSKSQVNELVSNLILNPVTSKEDDTKPKLSERVRKQDTVDFVCMGSPVLNRENNECY